MIDSHGRARTATAVIALLGALGLFGATAALAVPGDTSSHSRLTAQHRARTHHGSRSHHRRSSGHRHHITGGSGGTVSPIKHVIVIIGENHTFDNVFGTYQAPDHQQVLNLLSEGIVTASGAPGPAVTRAAQQTATDTTSYQVTPQHTGPYSTLPQPNTTYVSSGCDGQPQNQPDTRFPADLPNAPYQITKYVPYFDDHGQFGDTCPFDGAFVGDPIHRFYQMYQQVDGGRQDLWTWVHETAGDSNGAPPPSPFGPESTNQGALDMGFYNIAQGDAPTFNFLARHYSMSDNYHQSVMGGTGANHIMLGTGDAAFYQDSNGNATAPPAGEIENPNPQPGTNNFYTQDGYGQAGTTNGGSYSNCSDHGAPGVSGVFSYLQTLSYTTFHNGNCAPGHYYLLNNYNPGYNVDGSLNTSTFTVPPQQSLPTIGDELSANHISWGYFGEGYDNGHPGPNYCGICDPMQYASSIMTNPALRANIQHGVGDFDADAANGTLPAVSFLKPGDDDGHPGYSTLAAFEGFVQHAITEVQNNPSLWRNTAIFVTFDEGGGYYDSGYVQPVSFFGDGTRVPMIVVSPYAKPGYVSHTYTDHVSVLKFIERNWRLSPLSARSLDNLPDPTSRRSNPYVPLNRPSIGDMFDYFNFGHAEAAAAAVPRSRIAFRTGRTPERVPQLAR
ncbi:MAG: alkaline phosphatase family protein [Solirubrobacterales bacterium]|nr:alkaline phosphatase family protein [Solirubrobacterales bacterium]